ncbi:MULTISPECIES: exopolysaccharide transport family protein [unclassified Proteiniphilum]|jgi:capsular exopolysaccharide synthesis family protein|uniref:exopolysaccharide transport family protein n=1 Tax=unclassified Proteiniphilum TaxID=2622718 RepID=UPI002579F758|nr:MULTISPECIES: tyrosine-protein kinase [unclassified Proteiniphilum]
MYKYSEVEEEFSALAEKRIDLIDIIMKYLSYWKWFLLSIILSLAIAVSYIYITLPKYKVATSILFKDDQKGGLTEMNIFREMGVVNRKNNVDNEIEILKKSLIVESVVRKLNLYVTYTKLNPFEFIHQTGIDKVFPKLTYLRSKVIYGKQCPIIIVIPENILNNMTNNIELDVRVNSDGHYLFSGMHEGKKYYVGGTFANSTANLPFGEINVLKGNAVPEKSMVIRLQINHPVNVADQFLNALEIELTSKTSSVAKLSLECMNGELGRAFLKEYIETFNEKVINEQMELAEKTAILIDKHLTKLSNELSEMESQVQDYKQSQGLTDISSQADLFNVQSANMRQRKMEVESQYAIVSDLNKYVQQRNDHNQLIPANPGIKSEVLNAQINAYNNLVLERNKLARIASGSNQSMIDLNNRIESTFNSVKTGLQNEMNNLVIQQRDINALYSQSNARIRAIPRQERVYSDIIRQQNIKEALFLYLLQKKEERYMNMTTGEPTSRIIDNIRVLGIVSPNKKIIFFLFFVIGSIFPVVVIKIRDLLRYQIDTREDIEKISSIPVLGEIPKSVQSQIIAVKEDCNDSFNEMIRLLRANLLFVIEGDNKVINILSGISGDGKTFATLNLGMSLALLDKNVLIIELDIRKPKLAKILGLDSKKGVTLYLSGILDRNELVKPSGIHPNLYVITAGAVPPNPNEILSKSMLDELINNYKSEYDFIFLDTAPLGQVSDGFVLNRLADVNLYVARSGYTPKKYIGDADRFYRENRLKKIYFVLNSVNMNSMEYRYGFSKKYGYGY